MASPADAAIDRSTGDERVLTLFLGWLGCPILRLVFLLRGKNSDPDSGLRHAGLAQVL